MEFPIIDLRTPSFVYNHGGYYAPGDPKDCNTPNGPCCYCQDRIDAEAAALAAISKPRCATRPPFLEPCPDCNESGSYRTHKDCGLNPCNGCPEKVCGNCFAGARYFCPLRRIQLLPAPTAPLVRQEALGVQSPKAEEKTENK